MRSVGLLFPGQGSQSPGMASDWLEHDEEARRWFARASEVLGWDLARLCREGPESELARSDHAQPAIFVHSVVCWEALRRLRPELPCAGAAGLSSGEWTALYAAGVVAFEDAVRILQARGRFMQEACEQHPGGMISVIGLSLEALEAICRETGVEIANLNSPEQTVLSGLREAIDAAERRATEMGAKRVVRLTVAGAFHSKWMQPAADRFREFLRGFALRAPRFPVLSNVTGQPHGDPEDIREAMVRQVTGSVRWIDCVRRLQSLGVEQFIECGPGRVLAGLARKIEKGLKVHGLSAFSDLKMVADLL